MSQKILTLSAGGVLTEINDAYQGTVTSVAALTLGTTGTDLSSTVAGGTGAAAITLQVPTASATNRGALSSTDWSVFNGKYTPNTALSATTGYFTCGSNAGVKAKQSGQIDPAALSTTFFNGFSAENTSTGHCWAWGYSSGGFWTLNFFDGTSTYTNVLKVTGAGNYTFAGNVGFNGTTAIAKPTITGSRAGNAALASLLTALASYGLVTDSTTA